MSEQIHEAKPKAFTPTMVIPIGNTTFLVEIRFNEKSKETIDVKMKRLIYKEVQRNKTVS